MRKTIKKKTELRRLIRYAIGHALSGDYVEFYADWIWKMMPRDTISKNYLVRRPLVSLADYRYPWYKLIDQRITFTLSIIECELIQKRRERCTI